MTPTEQKITLPVHLLWQSLLVGGGYFVLAKLMLLYYSSNGMVTILWPSSGVALAALLRWGPRLLPAIFTGVLAVEMLAAPHAFFPASVIALAGTLEAWFGYQLLRRSRHFTSELASFSSFFALLYTSLLAPSVCALAGVSILTLTGELPLAHWGSNLLSWWMGDSLGLLMVTPLFLIWHKTDLRWYTSRHLLEGGLLFSVTLLLIYILLLDGWLPTLGTLPRAHWLFLPMLFAAVRMGWHGVLLVQWLVILFGLFGIHLGLGVFSPRHSAPGLLHFWLFLLIQGGVGMTIASILRAERDLSNTLRQREKYTRGMLDALEQGVMLFNPQGQIVSVNLAGERILEASLAELQQSRPDLSYWKAFREDLQPYPIPDSPVARALRGERVRGEILGTRNRDGTLRWKKVSATPLFDAQHAVEYALITFRDITQEKRLADEIQQQESTYRSLFENMLNSIVHARVLFDGEQPVDMLYLDVNPAFATITGITEPVVGRKISEVIPGYCQNNPESLAIFGGVARTRQPRRWEHYLPELDRWFSFMIYSPAPGEIIIITENINERKKAELALQASEKRFADIVQASSDWVWEVDAEARYTYASESVQDILGYRATELIGKTPFDLMPAEDAERVARVFATLALQQRPFRDLDNLNRCKDGRLRHIQTNGFPILDEHGKLLGYRGMDRDVTAQKQYELNLQRQRAELQARNTELERFNRAMIGREMDIIALKQQINTLSQQLGQPAPYRLDFLNEPERKT